MAPNDSNPGIENQAEENQDNDFNEEPVMGEEDAALEEGICRAARPAPARWQWQRWRGGPIPQYSPGSYGRCDSRQRRVGGYWRQGRGVDSATEFPLIGDTRDVKVGQVISAVQMGRHEDGSPRLSHRLARTPGCAAPHPAGPRCEGAHPRHCERSR